MPRKVGLPIGFFVGNHGPDWSFYRVRLPAGELVRRGYDVRVVPDLRRSTLAGFSTVVVHHPYSRPDCSLLLRTPRSTRVVLSLDENYHQIGRAHHSFDEKVHNIETGAALTELLERVDEVMAANAQLARHYGPFNPRMTVIPDMIDPKFFAARAGDGVTRDGLVIGWHGWRQSPKELAILRKVILGVSRDNEQVRWLFFGLRESPWKIPCECIPEVPFENLPWALARLRFDIGIVPLEDTEYNRCRTSLPCLELAACKVPIVASALPPCAEVIEHGVTGYLASAPEEWEGYLQELIHSPDKRRRMGQAAFDRLRERHGPQAIGSRYAELAARWSEA